MHTSVEPFTGDIVSLSGANLPLEKTDFPSTSRHQLLVAPLTKVTFVFLHSCCIVDWLFFVCRSYVVNHNHHEFMSTVNLSCLEALFFFKSFLIFRPYNIFTPLSWCSLGLGEKVVNREVLFIAEHSTNISSLHYSLVWISKLFILCCMTSWICWNNILTCLLLVPI